MLTAVVGINWGDEGKGRMVDLFSAEHEIVVRYQGGNNAGHTVVNERGKFVLNLLPSGILRPGTVNVLGPGMVLDLEHLTNEVAHIREQGVAITPEHLKISDRATICMPYHKMMDILEEDRLADKKFGSTRRGIGPVYADKYMKKTLRTGDLLFPDKLREKLMKIGDSVVVAHDSDFIKIHVHSNCPGKILQLALRLGEIDRIKIENMREQNRELLANMKKNEKENALVAVSISDGIDEVYKAIGVNNLISGGQTMNPSIDSITKAIRRANARNVFVLPNNSNIIMAAQQAAAISDRNVIVIPSKTMMQGLSAALAYSDDVDVETNTERMTAAIKQVLSGSVTYAVRDTQFNGEKISQGDIIGLLDNVITKVGTSVDSVAVELLCSMIENKGDDCMATIFYGEGADEDSAQAVADAVNEKYPDAEITVQYGGQPLYYYYFSVE